MPPVTLKKKFKQDRIIQAAAQAFARKGFAGTNMAEIAVQAGVGKGTLYEYFDSKDDLFFAVFEWFTRKLAADFSSTALNPGASAARQLLEINNALVNAWVELEGVAALLMEFWSASGVSALRDRYVRVFRDTYRLFRRIVSSVIRAGIDSGEFRPDVEPEAMASVLVGAWDGQGLQIWFDDAIDPVYTTHNFMRVVLRGMLTDPTNLPPVPVGDGKEG